ncbi:Trimethylguanosine synthase [Portunus trituberculatus]|uniref:Trimethylguanosine synthase n=1 Tax=Portunus trituberculatus TaxID=210409 RepID=A0A5B7EJX3_PORTR|nr:Trimethylguanosine synthase [Portunus trituberculatus]
MYWEAWKDVLIPLSWVHKYREHCNPEFITWYDSYVQDYPEVLPWITEELGVSELLEDKTRTSNLENGCGDSVETNVCEGKAVGTNVGEGREAVGTDVREGEAVGTSVCEGKATEGEDNSSDSEFDMTEFFDFLNGDIDSIGENAEVIVKDTESGKEDKSVSGTSKETGETRGGVSILVLDDLYTKHTKKRYLVHLRTFLRSSEVESSQDLDAFFKTEAGIDFNLQTATVEDETNTKRLSDDTGHSHSIKNKGKLKSQKQTEDTRKETLENGTGTYQPERSPITQGHNDRGGCDAVLCEERTAPRVSEATGGLVEYTGGEESTQGLAGGVCVSASQEHKTSKRRRKEDNVKSQGTSWALKYVQGKTATQSEASQPNKRPPVSPELHGAVPGTSIAPEPPETAPGALEVARTGEKDVADVVYLSPPWGGIKYLEEEVYNVYRLGGTMNCARLMRAARSITPNVALFLPRNSDVYQVIELAGVDGMVDVETAYMGPKKKAITAYFGDLAVKCFCQNYRSKIKQLN